MRIAYVHDWLTVDGGAEKVAKEILSIWDDVEVFSLVDFLSENDRNIILDGGSATTSFIQRLPFAKKIYRNYLPLFPLAIEQFDLSKYDLIISSSYAVAKGVLTNSNQLHICYCHTPMRYAWDLYHQYLNGSRLARFKSFMARLFLHYIRIWDYSSAQRVDYFIANSNYISKRIKKIYHRNSKVIYPPIDTESFEFCEKKEDFYLTASRLVPYKRIDLIIDAFREMPDKRLIVIGDGPELKRLKSKALKNVEVLGYQPFDTLKEYMKSAKAFVFAAEEDFGIVPLEAQACGTPVIAFGKGGNLETVLPGVTGQFFFQQTAEAIKEAVHTFEKEGEKFKPSTIRKHALRFSVSRFTDEIKAFVTEKMETHCFSS